MTVSRAMSSTMPLWARKRTYSSAKRSRSTASNGLSTVARPMSMPSPMARERTSISSPRIVTSAMPRLRIVPAARSTRSSVPSGSTMRLPAVLARSMRPYSNMSGVTTSERLTSRSSSSRDVSTCCSNAASAVSIFRVDSGESRPRVCVMRFAVS